MKRDKTGGREKGTPNKERKDLVEMLKDKYPNYNPVIALAVIANTSKDELMRFNAHKEVAKYIAPQLKSIEFKEKEIISQEEKMDLSVLTNDELKELERLTRKSMPSIKG